FAELRRRGKTILLVTYSLALVERFCDTAVWLDGGRVHAQGDPKRVVDAYLTDVEVSEGQQLATATARAVEATSSPDPVAAAPPDGVDQAAAPGGPAAGELMDMFRATEGRWGSRDVEIVEVAFVGRDLAPSFVFHSGDPMSIRLTVRAHQPVA